MVERGWEVGGWATVVVGSRGGRGWGYDATWSWRRRQQVLVVIGRSQLGRKESYV
jgi:hypothetical protein